MLLSVGTSKALVKLLLLLLTLGDSRELRDVRRDPEQSCLSRGRGRPRVGWGARLDRFVVECFC